MRSCKISSGTAPECRPHITEGQSAAGPARDQHRPNDPKIGWTFAKEQWRSRVMDRHHPIHRVHQDSCDHLRQNTPDELRQLEQQLWDKTVITLTELRSFTGNQYPCLDVDMHFRRGTAVDITTDAIPHGLGAVLSKEGHPSGYRAVPTTAEDATPQGTKLSRDAWCQQACDALAPPGSTQDLERSLVHVAVCCTHE